MCPHCGQNAPIVYRGVTAYCAACGQVRVPLTGSALKLAGQPARVGSIFANVFGWTVIGVGLSFALGAHKGGTLTAQDAAGALDMPLAAAEELLQSLAKEQYERVAVDVDANG